MSTHLEIIGNLPIVIGAIVSKLPQIMAIYNRKNSKGISLCSVTLDLISKTIFAFYTIAQGYPFGEWGESSILAIATLIIHMEIFWFADQKGIALVELFAYTTACFLLLSGLIPFTIIWVLQSMCIPLQLAAKLTQAVSIAENGNTGNISGASVLIMCVLTLVKTYSEYTARCDYLLVANNATTFAGNLIIGMQIIYYWSK
ncbi:mannose-P-dolichol utilization defect 1 protein homolog [Photinus pyralis]|uniref:mannose-P-dolichol utilization defect 1 protein homolog n=1 Tax=Photinus pyralis TaxID=7054 RepID=UPI00126760A7|nr:mannose-P-dolichol utilization defect 1 protein homolog [Photinus pyralis]